MSIPSFDHGRSGMTCGISSSQGLAGLYLAHMEHLDFVSSMSRPIPGQYMMERSLALHFYIPKWLSCSLVNISWRTLGCMTRVSSLNTRPSIMWSSSRSGQHCRVQMGVSLFYAGHPLMMRGFTICTASSAAVACFRKFILSLEIGREEPRLCILSSISSMWLSSAGGEDGGCARDSMSAMHTLVPWA